MKKRSVAQLISAMSAPGKRAMSEQRRRAAAEAGFGALRGVPGSVEEFLAERLKGGIN
jgi:hypothetical protein